MVMGTFTAEDSDPFVGDRTGSVLPRRLSPFPDGEGAARFSVGLGNVDFPSSSIAFDIAQW